MSDKVQKWCPEQGSNMVPFKDGLIGDLVFVSAGDYEAQLTKERERTCGWKMTEPPGLFGPIFRTGCDSESAGPGPFCEHCGGKVEVE